MNIAVNVPSIDERNEADCFSAMEMSDACASRGRGGRIRGRGRGGRGRRHGMVGILSTGGLRSIANPPDILGPVGWTTPQIHSDHQSPISLRPRCGGVDKGDTSFDVSADIVDLTTLDAP